MLIVVQRPREQVIAAVESHQMEAVIGPANAAGWITVWLFTDRPEVVTGSSPHLMMDDADSQWSIVVAEGAPEGSAAPTTAESPRSEPLVLGPATQGDSHTSAAMAEALLRMFGAAPQPNGLPIESLATLLRDGSIDLDALLAAFTTHLDLPLIEELEPTESIVIFHGPAFDARVAAAIGGNSVMLTAEGTVVIRSRSPEHRDSVILVGGASTVARRRHPCLLLWRCAHGCGVEVWRKGKRVRTWSWSDVWWAPPPGPEADTEMLQWLLQVAPGDVDESHVRALLRRRGSRDSLGELVAVLGLPPEGMDLLDAAPESLGQFPGAELVAKTSLGRLVADEALTGGIDAPIRVWSAAGFSTIVSVVAAAVSWGLVGLGGFAYATAGARAKVPGLAVAGHDAGSLLTRTAFPTLTLTILAIFRVRRWRYSRRPRPDAPGG